MAFRRETIRSYLPIDGKPEQRLNSLARKRTANLQQVQKAKKEESDPLASRTIPKHMASLLAIPARKATRLLEPEAAAIDGNKTDTLRIAGQSDAREAAAPILASERRVRDLWRVFLLGSCRVSHIVFSTHRNDLFPELVLKFSDATQSFVWPCFPKHCGIDARCSTD